MKFGAQSFTAGLIVVCGGLAGTATAADLTYIPFSACLGYIKVNSGRIVHYIGIVLARENVARSPHISGKLINFIEAAVDNISTE